MTFKSTRAELSGDTYKLHGDLTIKDVTRPVELDVEYNGTATDPYDNLRAGFEGRTTINRKDWGLGWNVAPRGRRHPGRRERQDRAGRQRREAVGEGRGTAARAAGRRAALSLSAGGPATGLIAEDCCRTRTFCY